MLPKPKGERDRGCVAEGRGEMTGGETSVDCGSEGGMDIDRSEVGVLSSTADAEGFGWLACRVLIWACCVRIMLRRRFYSIISMHSRVGISEYIPPVPLARTQAPGAALLGWVCAHGAGYAATGLVPYYGLTGSAASLQVLELQGRSD
jgi:hypothetical protein